MVVIYWYKVYGLWWTGNIGCTIFGRVEACEFYVCCELMVIEVILFNIWFDGFGFDTCEHGIMLPLLLW